MTQDPSKSSDTVSALGAILGARCPRCGKTPLFNGLLTFADSCPSCKLDYKFLDTGDGPAVFAIMILGGLVMGGALWFEFRFNPPIWQHVVLWGVVTPLLAIALLRLLKSGLAVLQYKNRAEEGRLAKD
mgnify:CR=1 FL=1